MTEIDPIQERVFRSRVADFLFGLGYPATKAAIIAQARRNNTASQITDALSRLPDRTYVDLGDIQAAVAYHPPHVWDVDGFPPEAIRHDEIEADRLKQNISRADRPLPPRR
jgi:glutathione S-transferase